MFGFRDPRPPPPSQEARGAPALRARTAVTRQLDPFRAGLELGEGLAAIDPEAVFLFSSIHYRGNPELLAGLFEALGNADLPLVGNTGDGFLCSDAVGEVGAAALGIHAQGRIHFGLASARPGASPGSGQRAIEEAIRDLQSQLEPGLLRLVFVTAGLRTDGALLAELLDQRLRVPAVGGLAGDDRKMQSSFVYAGREVIPEGIALLGLGGQVAFDIRVASTLCPVGQPGTVTGAQGTVLAAVDGVPALDFIEREAGKPVLRADRGVSAFALSDPEQPSLHYLRSVADFQGSGSISLFGSVRSGEKVQFCHASPEAMLEDVRAVAGEPAPSPSSLAAGLIVSCAGRKWVLGDDMRREVDAIRSALGRPVDLAGFPSYGEIAPRKLAHGASRNLFHNVTCVLLLLGAVG